MNLYGISQTREIERLAIESGLSALLLMKRAGFRAFNLAQSWFPGVKRVYVLCGAGNNGGDGFAFAGRLAS
jgi:NAD(P)H-hydrate repair Nnr-like enzyme with NAD(P)H-hydrate epimerase domain